MLVILNVIKKKQSKLIKKLENNLILMSKPTSLQINTINLDKGFPKTLGGLDFWEEADSALSGWVVIDRRRGRLPLNRF